MARIGLIFFSTFFSVLLYSQIEVVDYDVYHANNSLRKETFGSVVLDSSLSYCITVKGTYSMWAPSFWSNPCGLVENAPMYPSINGFKTGKVGHDFAYNFARANSSSCLGYTFPNLATPYPRISITLDSGLNWFHPSVGPYDSAHTYSFIVKGMEQPFGVRQNSPQNADDYGILKFEIVELPNLGADTTLCQGESIILDATTTNGSYRWQGSSTAATFTVTQAGQYWVEVSTNGCSTSDTINVSYQPLPTVSLGNDTTLCDGETLTLDATNSGATYLWQDNSTNATFTVTQADTFYVAVELNGCISRDSIIVDYQSYPIVDLGADTTLCQGKSLTLDATNSGATYAWQDNSTNSTFTVTQAGKYWVDVTTNGCSTSDTINVSYKPLPTVSLGNDTTLCDGETLTLDATNSGATYLWQDNSTNATFTVTQADTFYVAVELNGCISRDSIIVDYQSYPIVDLGADTTLCQGESLSLDATTSNASYLWQDNSTAATFTVSQAGQYWVEVTINGCSVRDTANISYKSLPMVNLGNDTTLCDGESLTLDATNSGATYLWQDNSTNATFTVTQADTFYVAVELNGCISRDSIIVDYQGDLSPVFKGDTTICAEEELKLDATAILATDYLWFDSSVNGTFIVSDSGAYWVQISSLCDTLRDTIYVNLKDCACEFEAPNVFTPNGDGVNDYFYPNIKCQLISYEMSIYNRWGDLVYYSNQPLLHWDGRVNTGKKASEGYYTYIIEYRDVLSGQKSTEKGTFIILH